MADLYAGGARVVSVFGPFASRALVDMPASDAEDMFDAPLGDCGPSTVVDAVQTDIDSLGEKAPVGLAALAMALAREIEHPYNSATSKSMCAKALMDAMERLRELAPPRLEADAVDELARRRYERRDGSAGATVTPGS